MRHVLQLTPIPRAALALLLQLFVVLASGAVVLCVEPGGASVLEVVLSGCCDEQAPEDAPAQVGADDCGSCSDQVLELLQDRVERDELASFAPTFAPTPDFELRAYRIAARHAPRACAPPSAPPRPGPTLAALRTTVIRC